MNKNLNIRFAKEEDLPQIFDLVKGLAEYEKLSDGVVVTEDLLHKWIFQEKIVEVLMAEVSGTLAEEIDANRRPEISGKEDLPGTIVGMALFFRTFSTFCGQPCLYLEDLYLYPAARGKGIGKALLKTMARIAVDRGYARFEWECLDRNEPSIRFYESLGGVRLTDRRKFRLTGEALEKFVL